MGLFDDLLNRRKQEQEAKSSKRLPPGQSLTNKFPVLTYGPNARFDVNTWDMRFFGEVRPKSDDMTYEGEIGVLAADAYQLYNEIFWERDHNKAIAAASPELQDAIRAQAGTVTFDSQGQAAEAVNAVITNPTETKTVSNDNMLRWNFEQFLTLPTVEVFTDIHCVTRWSKFDTTWVGVRFRDFCDTFLTVSPQANYVIAHCDYGYTTNLPIDAMMEDDVLLTYTYEGMPIEPDHGGPVRSFVPQRYFWKSAKFLRGIEFSADDKPGFWERNGYHNDGDPFKEERYGSRRGFF